MCGTILNRQKLLYCESCGAVIGPARYLDFISGRLNTLTPKTGKEKLCETCARKKSAKALSI
jgi:hypothetical protein